jgi:hypothetical protein
VTPAELDAVGIAASKVGRWTDHRAPEVPCAASITLMPRPVADHANVCGLRWVQIDPRDHGHGDDHVRVRLDDRKGGDPSEWPTDLRVRAFPGVAS